MEAPKKIALGAAALFGLGACATPGIDYEARLMANAPEAAAKRNVIVDYFSGPMGAWYTDQFTYMLTNATLDGKSWFRLADYAEDLPADAVGIYSGFVDIVDYNVHEYTKTVRKCVEWDGLFDCETRADVEEFCVDESVEVVANTRLINRATGELIYQSSYGGEAGRETCEEDPYYWGSSSLSRFAYDAPPELVRSALRETLPLIRTDIAPRNATVRAEFVTEALEPMVRADPAFEQGVEAVARDPFTSCSIWLAMSKEYKDAPAIIHNMGACAEASADFPVAQAHYARAADLARQYTADSKATAPYIASLERLSSQRFDLELIDWAAAADENAPGQRDPIEDVAPETGSPPLEDETVS